MGGSGSLTDKVAFEQRWEGREGMSHMGVAPDQGCKKEKKKYIDNHQRGVSLPGAKESLGGGG